MVTPEELANLAHLRRARDLMDHEYDRPEGCIARDLTRTRRRESRIGEALVAPAP